MFYAILFVLVTSFICIYAMDAVKRYADGKPQRKMNGFFSVLVLVTSLVIVLSGCDSRISVVDAYETNKRAYVVHKASFTTYTVTPVDGSDAPTVVDALRIKGYSVDVYAKNRIYEALR